MKGRTLKMKLVTTKGKTATKKASHENKKGGKAKKLTKKKHQQHQEKDDTPNNKVLKRFKRKDWVPKKNISVFMKQEPNPPA